MKVDSEELVQLLTEVTDSVPALISYITPDYCYRYCNHTYEKWFGIPQSQIVGKTMNEVLGEDAWRVLRKHVDRALKGQTVKYEEELPYIHGGPRWVDVTYIPRFHHDAVHGVVVLVNDISARKRAEEDFRKQEEELRLFFELGPVGMVEIDPDTNRFIHVNQKFCEITGYSNEELRRLTFLSLTHPEDVESEVKGYQKLRSGSSELFCREKRYIRKNKSVIWVRVSAKFLRNPIGTPRIGIGIVEDITDRRRVDEELRSARDHLEKQVAERTEELTEAVDELQRSNKELEAFAYIASHDLQEPLRMVTNYVQLIQHNIKTGELHQYLDQYIEYAVDGAKRMKTLIQDLLDYSRVRSRPLEIQSLSMNEVVLESISNLQITIQETKAHIDIGPLPTMAADHFEMVQLFQNLLSNSIKFRGNKPLQIKVTAMPLNQDCWRFEVSDNGIGIPGEFKNKIFQIFQRLHPREKYEGTGIGLAICKRVVERHDGSIWVESKPGEGSRFIFTLPTKLSIRNLIKNDEIRFSPEVI